VQVTSSVVWTCARKEMQWPCCNKVVAHKLARTGPRHVVPRLVKMRKTFSVTRSHTLLSSFAVVFLTLHCNLHCRECLLRINNQLTNDVLAPFDVCTSDLESCSYFSACRHSVSPCLNDRLATRLFFSRVHSADQEADPPPQVRIQ
jgi:hypothetical protein